jgi:Spy/CpxP family protein refolding chaperone
MNDQSTGPRRTRLTGAVVLATVFVVGALSGAAIDRAVSGRQATSHDRAEQRDRQDRTHHYVFEQLDLTQQQKTRIDSVLDVRRSQVTAFWDSAGPHWRAIVDSTKAGIRAVLTPEQRAEYERLLEQRRSEIRRRDSDRQAPGNSPGGQHD